jgi:hypothetical protein
MFLYALEVYSSFLGVWIGLVCCLGVCWFFSFACAFSLDGVKPWTAGGGRKNTKKIEKTRLFFLVKKNIGDGLP